MRWRGLLYNANEQLFRRRHEYNVLTAVEIKRHLSATLITGEDEDAKPTDLMMPFMVAMAADKDKQRTREIYESTIKRVQAFDSKAAELRFVDITTDWLKAFDAYMAKTAPSRKARNIHLRNIRAVFNKAIDEEVATHYPFRKFKLKAQKTPKRALTVAELRHILFAPLPPHLDTYRDVFSLIFMLIGINLVDLCQLRRVVGGRIEYYRAKTGRYYSIKVEPEAQRLIDKSKAVLI